MTDRESLLRAICEEPGRDDLRVVYADLCETEGDAARAEFIRVQCLTNCSCPPLSPPNRTGTRSASVCQACRLPEKQLLLLRRREADLLAAHWHDWAFHGATYLCNAVPDPAPLTGAVGVLFRRGFVAEVRTTLAGWYGGVCGRCDGDGERHGSDRPFEWTPDVGYPGKCLVCHGTGRTPGHGPAVMACQPVTTVDISDAGEHLLVEHGFWWSHQLTQLIGVVAGPHPTRDAALAALSAAILWARGKVLQPIGDR